MRSPFHLQHANRRSPNAIFASADRLPAWHLILLLLKCPPPEAALMDLPLQEETLIMTKKLIGLVAVIAVIGSSATLFAQEGTKPANVGEGALMQG